MLKQLTKRYVQAFNDMDVNAVSELLGDNFSLEDPVVKRIEGKDDSLEAMKNIFDSCKKLSFNAKNIYQDDMTTIIEFELVIDDTKLKGTDIIEWKDHKMHELRAYLDIPCGDSK